MPTTPTFTAGTFIGRTFSIWSQNLVAFSAISLIVNVPLLLLSMIQRSMAGDPSMVTAILLLSLVTLVVALVVSSLATGAVTFGVLQSLKGKPVAFGELFKFGMNSFGRVLGIALNVGVRVFLWSLLLVVPGVMAACRLFVSVPIRVAEPTLSTDDCMKRSGSLTENFRTAIFLGLLLFSVLSMCTAVFNRIGGIGVLLAWIGSSILGSLTTAAAGVAYHDLRVQKEGVDTAAIGAVFE